ncbi:uncharacterized protein LOC133299576 [Gastrolobium bilobum]|uniref:uncharacterized protein LOC133299576 n=1 Tax=Gastrolobium bilobum TaxID=150636 RepID=UPI002AB15D70|nr:uncharacterized protein LOC133299576 [Gastrolobium bilobum]
MHATFFFKFIHHPIVLFFLACKHTRLKQIIKGCLYLYHTKLEKMESSLGDMLLKVIMFIIVQALVYLILTNSSNIFSKNIKRSNSFKPARSVSIRRMLALLSDFPPEGEPSPSSKSPQSPTLQNEDKLS